ncbi:TPA: type 1 fimbrial protein [Serratia fonticola]|nr:type 1 fimbrial protein [Serratia fonticola]
MRTVMRTTFGRFCFSCVALVCLALLGTPGSATANVNVHLVGNLVVGTCDLVLESGGQKVDMRGVLASEFETVQTASIHNFQLIITDCNGVDVGHSLAISVQGTTLTQDNKIFNDNPSEELGFMLKENGTAAVNYWPGTKADYYNASGTVIPGQESQTMPVPGADPTGIRLNYIAGIVSPKMGVGAVTATPRKITATVTFNVEYH